MDIPAIEKHYIENQKRFLKRMYFRAGSNAAAEDIVQTAYERAIRYRKTFKGEYFDRWFNTILNNALREYQNNEKGYSYRDEEDEETTEDTSCPHYPKRVYEEILELIATKSLVQQEVLSLFFIQEYTAIDISRITEHSYARTHQIVQRFREELKELYKE